MFGTHLRPLLPHQMDATYASTADYVKIHILGFEAADGPGEDEEKKTRAIMKKKKNTAAPPPPVLSLTTPSLPPLSRQTAAKSPRPPRPTQTPTWCGGST